MKTTSFLENIELFQQSVLEMKECTISFNEIFVSDIEVISKSLMSFISVKSIYTNMKFEDVSLNGCYFVESHFVNCIFKNISFNKGNFNSTILKASVFENCSFLGAEIIGSKIENSEFNRCSFRDIIFSSKFKIVDKQYSAIEDNIEVLSEWTFY
jgi:uncharacterized protein YjbI with pentapeptide repeats